MYDVWAFFVERFCCHLMYAVCKQPNCDSCSPFITAAKSYIMETNLVLDKAHSQRKLPNMDNTLPATAVYRFHCAQFGEVPENEATPSYVRL